MQQVLTALPGLTNCPGKGVESLQPEPWAGFRADPWGSCSGSNFPRLQSLALQRPGSSPTPLGHRVRKRGPACLTMGHTEQNGRTAPGALPADCGQEKDCE